MRPHGPLPATAVDQLGGLVDVDRGQHGMGGAALRGMRDNGVAVVERQEDGAMIEQDGRAGPMREADLKRAVRSVASVLRAIMSRTIQPSRASPATGSAAAAA
jgi:hypothetical protein